MKAKYTESFRIQAVEKAVSRNEDIGLRELAGDLGVGYSTLYRCVAVATQSECEPARTAELTSMKAINKEKRPQDWNLEERLEMIISCGTLDDEAVSELCRSRVWQALQGEWSRAVLQLGSAANRFLIADFRFEEYFKLVAGLPENTNSTHSYIFFRRGAIIQQFQVALQRPVVEGYPCTEVVSEHAALGDCGVKILVIRCVAESDRALFVAGFFSSTQGHC